MTTGFYNTGLYGNSGSTTGYYYGTGASTATFWNTDYLEKKNEYNQTREGIEIENSARDGVMNTQISNFTNYMESGREDEAMEAYQALIEEMSNQTRYAGLSEAELQAIAREIIEIELSNAAGEDVDLVDYIREHAADATEQHKQRTLYCDDKVDSVTEEQLLNAICGMNEEEYVSGGAKVGHFLLNVVTLGGLTEAWDGLFGKKHH